MIDSYQIRMDRAWELFANLRSEIVQWLASKPYVLETQIRPATVEEVKRFAAVPNQPPDPSRVRNNGTEYLSHAVVIRFEPEPPIARWSVTLSEVLQHFHSSLDYLAYELNVFVSGRRPPPDESRIQFPIATRAEDWNRQKKRLGPIGEEAIDLIESYQPYHNVRDQAQQWALRTIHELNNRNKHRALIRIGFKPNGLSVSGMNTLKGGCTPMLQMQLGRLETGTCVAQCLSPVRFDGFAADDDLGLEAAVPQVPTPDGPMDLEVTRIVHALGNSIFTLIRSIEKQAGLPTQLRGASNERDV